MAKIDDILCDGTIQGHVVVIRFIGLDAKYEHTLYDGEDPYHYEIDHAESDINFMYAKGDTLYIELQPITGEITTDTVEHEGVNYPIVTINFDTGYETVVGPVSLDNELCIDDYVDCLDDEIAYYIDDQVLATNSFDDIVRELIEVDPDILEEI